MEVYEEESSASSSSSEVQASQKASNRQINSGPSTAEEKVQVSAASSNTIVTQKRKAGRRKFRETRHPIFRGVRERKGGKWVCEVREPNKKSRIWLGTFRSPEMAARAYDVAALALRGNSALLNFADSAWTLPRPKSSSPRDIQLAALQAAESFSPQGVSTTTSSTADVDLPHVNEGKKGATTENSTGVEGERGESGLFVDEEALLNMPALLDSMAEGMLLTPPSMKQRFSWDDVDCQVDMSLWPE